MHMEAIGDFVLDWAVPIAALVVGTIGTVLYMFQPVNLEALKFILLLVTLLATSDVALRIRSFKRLNQDIKNIYLSLERLKTIEQGVAGINQTLQSRQIDPAKASLLELLVHPEVVSKDVERDGLKAMESQFWSTEKTKATEATALEIWVAAPELIWELDPGFSPVIFENIRNRPITMRVLYLNNSLNRDKWIDEIEPKLKSIPKWDEKVKYVPVPEKDFIWCIEHVLYDNEHCILINLITNRLYPLGYNIELTPVSRRIFAQQFITEWNKEVTDPKWRITSTQNSGNSVSPNVP